MVLEGLCVATVHAAQGVTDELRGIEHRLDTVEAAAVGMDRIFVQHVHHGLRYREVARRQQHQHAIAGTLEHVHLAEGVDVIDTRVGARVGKEHHAGVEQGRNAISHG